jgi:outer membrane receptor for ferrienterochelin and colicin
VAADRVWDCGPGGLYPAFDASLDFMNNHIKLLAALSLLSLARPEAQAQAQAQAQAPRDTLTVTARAKEVTTKLDRKVYRLDNDLQATTGSAADVLNNVPSVSVDGEGQVSLRGNAKVTILVDGKPSPQFSGASGGDGLLQLQASQIDQIEIITAPSAQFSAEGGGVINIITKRAHKAGLSGSVTLSLGDKQRYQAGYSLNYAKGPLNFSGSLNLRNDDKLRIVKDERETVATPGAATIASTHYLKEHLRRLLPSGRANLSYAIDPKTTAGFELSHTQRYGERIFNQHDETLDKQRLATKVTDRHSDGYEWRIDAAQGLSLERKLQHDAETLRFNWQRSVMRERETYLYSNRTTVPPQPDSRDRLHLSLDLVTTHSALDYILPLSNGRTLKLGYDLTRQDNNYDNSGGDVLSSGLYAPNPDISNSFRYRQKVEAAYVTLASPLGQWDSLTGFRFEQTNVRTLQINGGLINHTAYARLYPSLHLSRHLSEHDRLSLSVSRRVARPDPEELNPYRDYQDIRNLRAGNPDLLPQDTVAIEAGFGHDKGVETYEITAYARFNRNSVTDVTRVLSEGILLTTKTNLPKSRAVGLEFSRSGHLTSKLSYGLSGNAFSDQIDATGLGSSGLGSSGLGSSGLGSSGLKTSTGVNLKSRLDYRPTPKDTAQVSINSTDKRLTPQGVISAITLVNAGFRHQITSDLAAVVTVTDLLNSQKYQRLISTAILTDRYERQNIGQIAYIGLTYSFGGGKKTKSGFDYDQ